MIGLYFPAWKSIHSQKGPFRRFGLRVLVVLIALGLAGCYPATYREVAPSAPKQPVTQVYFYPLKNQTSDQQARDHYECYNWAVKQTGFDPSSSTIPEPQRVKVVPMPPPGHDTAVLAIAGAVLGALIGGRHNAAGGAIIGGVAGGLTGAVSDASRQQYAQEMEEAYNRQDRALDARYEENASNFRRAMSACLQGRGYSVR
jgi:hypothetical protein